MAATAAKQWKSNTGAVDLPLPSGNVCRAKPVGPEAFLKSGFIPDPLSRIVMDAVNSKKGLPPEKMEEITEDPKKLAAAMETFDRILCYAVIEPTVEMPPKCARADCDFRLMDGNGVHLDSDKKDYHRFVEPPRDDEILYADQVDLNDKIFIFNWCVGGTSDVERFRDELAEHVGDVSAVQAVPDATE